MVSKSLQKKRKGFSLIELVIVVVIIGIIGAIAIPRLSRGAEGAGDSALKGDLAVLRNAIDLYKAEHNAYPTTADQLTKYTDASGATSDTKTSTHIYGPYMRKIPALKVGAEAGSTDFTATAGTADCGWVYDATNGTIVANTTALEKDAAGVAYNSY